MNKEEQLKQIIRDTLWMAIRYAHGRHTVAPCIVRDAVKRMKALYPEWSLKPDTTIQAPQAGELGGMAFRDDYLDDLFTGTSTYPDKTN
jgi:hypothetical protein